MRHQCFLVLAEALHFSVAFHVVSDEDHQQELDKWYELCKSETSDIIKENCKQGSPSEEWDINGAGHSSIQGFATEMSVTREDVVKFKVKSDSSDYRIDIYRAGYYRGLGARLIDTVRPEVTLPQIQPDCFFGPETLLVDCGNWAVSASWKVPSDAVSGVYFARLVRMDGPRYWRTDASEILPSPKFANPAWDYSEPPPCGWGYDCEGLKHAYGATRRKDGAQSMMKNALREPIASHVFFVVREDRRASEILFQTSDTTWHAYNTYGAPNTYGVPALGRHGFKETSPRRSYKRSYNTPVITRDTRSINAFFGAEYPMVRWLERNGFDVSYWSGVDTHRRGSTLSQHRVFLSLGHDEYWSRQQRLHVEAARDEGMNAAFLSGNEVYWSVRWESSKYGHDQSSELRTMVVYKESQASVKIDPHPEEWTGTFRDSRSINPRGAWPENALTGTIFTVNAWRNDALEVPYLYANQRIWRSTPIAELKEGQRAVLQKGLLGHEWDEDIDNGFRPHGLIRMSETHVTNVMYIVDHGAAYDSASATHHLVMYRAKSGALVFGAGTVQWSWGLDSFHDASTGLPNQVENDYNTRVCVDQAGPERAVQQAMVNVFADMGVQPGRGALQADLVRQEPSTDKTPPISYVERQEEVDGWIVIEGSAQDDGGGVVAGVEVSSDNGTSWHPAVRLDRRRWRYIQQSDGVTHHVLSRATDDSCNMETPAGVRQASDEL